MMGQTPPPRRPRNGMLWWTDTSGTQRHVLKIHRGGEWVVPVDPGTLVPVRELRMRRTLGRMSAFGCTLREANKAFERLGRALRGERAPIDYGTIYDGTPEIDRRLRVLLGDVDPGAVRGGLPDDTIVLVDGRPECLPPRTLLR